MEQPIVTHTYEMGNATIVVHRPALEEKEREKREWQICHALANYGAAVISGKKKEVRKWESSR